MSDDKDHNAAKTILIWKIVGGLIGAIITGVLIYFIVIWVQELFEPEEEIETLEFPKPTPKNAG